VLSTVVQLAGMQMQIEKQQVATRTIPEDETTAKAYLKKKFPQIAGIADAKFSVAGWTRTFVAETDEFGDPIDDKLPRGAAAGIDDMPRELVKGNISEWMRKKVGRMTIEFALEVEAAATEDEKARLEKVPTRFVIMGTNATTKIYKGVSSYTAGEQRPSGIAQAYYETLQSGCYYSGSVRLVEDDVGATRWHGAKLSLTGGVSAWGTMGAPIHSVGWDLESPGVDRGCGPNPDYAVQDFVEFLRLLNKRPHTAWTTEERTADTLGAAGGVSARGDSIGPFDIPETIYEGGAGGGGEEFAHPFKLTASVVDEVPQVTIAAGSITDGSNGTAVDLAGVIDTAITATAGHVVIKATVDPATLALSSWAAAIVSESDAAKEVVFNAASPPGQTEIRLHIGKVAVADGVATVSQAQFTSVRIVYGILNGVAVRMFEAAPTHPGKV
jgi:hypothetical protein